MHHATLPHRRGKHEETSAAIDKVCESLLPAKSVVMVGGTSEATENDSIYLSSRYLRFYSLVIGILVFFGCHNYLQELIMSLPDFKIAVMLAFLEVLGVTVCSYIELLYSGETKRKSSLMAYGALCFMLILSSTTSNVSLNYINYPTKVVFRSCKIIPTLAISTCLNKKRVYWFEYVFGALISVGMILFATADFQSSPDFDFIGIVLVCVSVIADAFLPNIQERVFDQGSSRVEVTFYTNIFTLMILAFSTTASGDLQKTIFYAMEHQYSAAIMLTYTFMAYIAIMFHMTLVQEFGGITAVLVGNFRKALTIVLSFIAFPKLYHPYYVLGGILVFGGLTVNAFMKEAKMKAVSRTEGTAKREFSGVSV